jgi:sugar lactone lactonase YvrE
MPKSRLHAVVLSALVLVAVLLSALGCTGALSAIGAAVGGGVAESLAPDPKGPVSGTVLDAAGKPAANITVTAYLNNANPLVGGSGGALIGNSGAGLIGNSGSGLIGNTGAGYRIQADTKVKTDAQGRFVLTPPQAGIYNLEAVENDNSKAWKAAVSFAGGDAKAAVGTLGLAPTGSISGKVRSPIATVTDFSDTSVYIPGSGYIAKTRKDGTYTIPNVPAGTFELVAFNDELGDGALPDTDNPGAIRVVSGETTSAAALTLKTMPPEITELRRVASVEITDNGAPGAEIEIQGKFFGFARGVRFEVRFAAETGVSPVRESDTKIRVKVPGAALSGNVQVFVGNLQSNAKPFRVMKSLATTRSAVTLAAGTEADLGADVVVKDTRDEPIVEFIDNGVTKFRRPNVAWQADSTKALVSERGVLKAVSEGKVTVTARAGDLPGFNVSVTILPAGSATPTPAPTSMPDPNAAASPTASPAGGATPTPSPTASPAGGATPTPAPTPTPQATPTPGYVETLAGGGAGGNSDGFGTAARFSDPMNLCLDADGNLVVAEAGSNKIRTVTKAGMAGTLAGTGSSGKDNGPAGDATFYKPQSVAFSQGAVYVADTTYSLVRRIKDGLVSTFAGGSQGYADGPGAEAKFNWLAGIAADGNGNLFVADTQSGYIRKIDSSGYVTTIAGAGSSGFSNGTGSAAKFKFPQALAVGPDGSLYVADTGNNAIRKVTQAGVVTTYAGTGQSSLNDGPGDTAAFYEPYGIAVDASGNVFVADRSNHRIRKITPSRDVSTYAGTTSGKQNGPKDLAKFNMPTGVAVASDGTVYVSEQGNDLIRVIRPQP